MGLLRLSGFSGEWPIRDPRALPDNAALSAINVGLDGGAYLRGSRSSISLKALQFATRHVFRVPLSGVNSWSNSYWREFTDENTSVFRSPLVNDSFERIYWGSPTEGLRYLPKASFIAGATPGFTLGVLAPTTAPSIPFVTGGDPDLVVTREYLVTFVNAYGEESQPSPIVEFDGPSDGIWNIVSIPQPPAAGTYAAFSHINLYRTVTGETGVTDFYKVIELAVGIPAFADDIPDTNLVTILESKNFALPLTGTQGLALMPNGIFVTWKDSNLYFSENFRPHAWPAEYTLTVDYPIVGVAVFGSSLVVCTTGNPSIVSGVNAASMTLQKTDAPLPCLSRRSIVAGAEGVFYASEEGLILVNPAGVQTVTRDLISRDQWRTEFSPATQKAMYIGGEYIAAITQGITQSAFRFMPSNPSVQGVSFDSMSILNFGVEPWTGRPWAISTNTNLYEWEVPNAPRRSYTWLSREFVYPFPTNFAVYQAYFDDSLGGLLHVKMWATLRGNSGATRRVLVYDSDIEASGREIKLPSGFKSDVWQFEFSGDAELQSFMIATNAQELRRA